MISTVLAASVAVLGACDPKTTEPVKPVSTPVPVASSSPSPSPSPSPSGTPLKGTPTPGGKKTDDKGVKPTITQTPKGK